MPSKVKYHKILCTKYKSRHVTPAKTEAIPIIKIKTLKNDVLLFNNEKAVMIAPATISIINKYIKDYSPSISFDHQ